MTLCKENIKETILSFGKNADMLVSLTIKDAEKYLAETESSIGQEDPTAAGMAAHALKSVMRQIQATDVSDVAFEIEKSGKSGDLAGCKERLNDLKQKWKETKILLESLCLSEKQSC